MEAVIPMENGSCDAHIRSAGAEVATLVAVSAEAHAVLK
jgi:hypothetical protein